ncbi:transposase [Colidextribacter sp. 210702-DFI.3.9]|nr:transposase [Colidextribacter sp. 210702-DFI.3.9]MCG4470098.1 transposase [Lawsonibacter sp. DFI.6.74]MCG4774512.1 transposase [Lawsonibacter sp. DFI.5.51]
MGKIKFTPEKKIEIIEAYKSGKVAYSQLQDVYGMNRNEIYRWILKYEANGIDAFVSGNRRYSKEFKIHCIEEYLSGIGSVDDIVAKYNISNREVLRKWIQRYNANKELKDYDPKREVYMVNARRKTTLEERKEIVAYCITHNNHAVKQDFAASSGLISKAQLFSDEELSELYRSTDYLLENGPELQQEHLKAIQTARTKIEYIVPNLQERLEPEQNQGQLMN